MPFVSTTGIGSDLHGKAAGGRKLIAVVNADTVGDSPLIGQDDAGTLRRLRTLRRALIDPAIRRTAPTCNIARDLQVRYVMEGSVRRPGERVRVTAQLIEAETSAGTIRTGRRSRVTMGCAGWHKGGCHVRDQR